MTGIRVPRMNAIMERWIRTCRTELLDRALIVNQIHLLHALREFKGSTTTTEHTAPCMPQLHVANSSSRSPNQTDWITSPSGDKIDSAASFTSITMPPEQHG